MSFPYLTSNLYVNFPFTEDATLKSTGLIDLPINFFADAVIDTTFSVSGAYVKTITSGDLFTDPFLDFLIADLSGTALITLRIKQSTYALQAVIGGYNPVTKIAARIVCGTAVFADLVALIPTSITFLVAGSQFSEHVFTRGASKVLRLKAAGGPFREQIPIKLQAGNNMFMEILAPETPGDPTRVVFSAVPGAGAGVVPPGASPVPAINYIASLGSAIPDATGNVIVQGDDCYRVRLFAGSNPNAISLFNDCTPCCKCKDYEKVATALAKLQKSNDTVKESLIDLQEFSNQTAVSWNNSMETRRRKLFVTTTMIPQDKETEKISVTIVIVNNFYIIDPPSYPNITVNLSVELPSPYGMTVEDGELTLITESSSGLAGGGYFSSLVTSSAVGAGGTASFQVPSSGVLKPKEWASVTFRISRTAAASGVYQLKIKDPSNLIDETATFQVT